MIADGLQRSGPGLEGKVKYDVMEPKLQNMEERYWKAWAFSDVH